MTKEMSRVNRRTRQIGLNENEYMLIMDALDTAFKHMDVDQRRICARLFERMRAAKVTGYHKR